MWPPCKSTTRKIARMWRSMRRVSKRRRCRVRSLASERRVRFCMAEYHVQGGDAHARRTPVFVAIALARSM
eukprot:3096487-Alexandrium_andersonii.AAC.1